jgi:hypothetical protein
MSCHSLWLTMVIGDKTVRTWPQRFRFLCREYYGDDCKRVMSWISVIRVISDWPAPYLKGRYPEIPESEEFLVRKYV